jgi:tellurite resistance protein TerA
MATDYPNQASAPAQSSPPAQNPGTSNGGSGAPVSLTKVTLTKSSPGVSLTKSGSARGILRVNLNWNARPAQQQSRGGFLKRLTSSSAAGIDLDLGCLYEFADGSTGVVQALGNAFRDTRRGDPICWLDGDDRSGSTSGGENLFINLEHLPEIRRVLVFAYIYEGTPSWAAANAVVTLFPTTGAQVEVRLDEPDPHSTMCAIALLTNSRGELSVRREVNYVAGHQRLDQAYQWGLRWAAARK